MKGPLIGVIGGSSATPEEAALAEGVGRALAQADALLICGGRGGVMEAACKGARAGGGLTIGVLPGGDRSEANDYVDIAIATGIGYARNAIIVRAADGVIAVGGSYGTLSEIGLALGYHKPLVGLWTWEMEREGHVEVPVARAKTPEEAVKMILQRVRSGG